MHSWINKKTKIHLFVATLRAFRVLNADDGVNKSSQSSFFLPLNTNVINDMRVVVKSS